MLMEPTIIVVMLNASFGHGCPPRVAMFNYGHGHLTSRTILAIDEAHPIWQCCPRYEIGIVQKSVSVR
jgi:hypothetical protein